MLSERITYLLKKLDVENSVIASYAGCTPANFCRLKSGARQYSINSITIKKFTEGIYSYCCDNGKLDDLCILLSTAESDERTVTRALVKWLFEDDSLNETDQDAEENILFGKKLCTLMEIAKISNVKLSKALSIDPSYVSRMRSGKRIPKKSTGLMVRLCSVLAERISEQGKQKELEEITGANVNNNRLSELIFVWLYDRDMPANVQAVRNFIEQMNSMSSANIQNNTELVLPKVPTQEFYLGDKGLQQAVIRFLGGVIDNHSREIRLYSDNAIDWMTGDFKQLWAAMMKACLKNGTHIRIIHNVDRSVNEMIQAIICWMPLYMTGLISPYYSTRANSDKFTCTLFIDPDNSCVQSFGVREMSSEAEYCFITDERGLDKGIRSYNALLTKCRPLLRIESDYLPSPDAEEYMIGNVRMIFDEQNVIIQNQSRLSSSFIFSYAPMCKAFRSFADTIKEIR